MYSERRGISLIEILIVIGIISLLLQLAIPAVQAAREDARRMDCQNNLRQIGIAVLTHENTFRRLPTGGWTHRWIGDPDRGNDKRQPGSWVYNLLPFVEQQALHDLGRGQSAEAKRSAAKKMCETPLSLFICPTRRSVKLYPFSMEDDKPQNFDEVAVAAKSDYAGNGGEIYVKSRGGPSTLESADTTFQGWADPSLMSGVIYQRSETKLSDISDGTTKTYLIGEKYADPNRYNSDDITPGDDQTMYVGYDADTIRWAAQRDGRDLLPTKDELHNKLKYNFGSAHNDECNFVMCDGSIRLISYQIDAKTHRYLANRHDGEVVEGQ
jgi:type II secretory pathway pseudopilin PulG